jgi:hypothetical protein
MMATRRQVAASLGLVSVAWLSAARASAGEAEQAVLAAQDKRVAATLAGDLATLDAMPGIFESPIGAAQPPTTSS